MSVHWNPVALAQGDAGQALFCAELDRAFPEQGWAATGHAFLTRAARSSAEPGQSAPSVISGVSGLAFAARLLGDGDRYRSMVADLDRTIARGTLALVAELHGRSGVGVSGFDLISGLSGITTYLLPAEPGGRPGAACEFAVKALADLVLAPGDLPAWRTPVELLYDEDQMRQYPDGNLNCGLAHGIPGPLAALSLAWTSGQQRGHTQEAIVALAEWLVANAGSDDGAPRWAAVIPTGVYGRRDWLDRGGAESRDAWCYGTPGVARALYLAGAALDRPDWRTTAVRAMEGVYRRPPADRGIDSPTFCHGVAGLLQITLRFGYDTGLPVFAAAAGELTEQVLASVDPDRPMAVANVEPGGVLVDQPGLLDGATGVGLTLLGAVADEPPAWDRVFALG